ncbi:hypothetical protein F2Q70_00008586 [Brassica cretica]|uniref:ethanolamine-phosphate cytidylyltransferase n=1 Tax=Brassica cretica TaxID=69181 RepID=A0A8S9M149_BRACR|nr:hypothetical protein F2Q70_00008586 [Brassica cretica]
MTPASGFTLAGTKRKDNNAASTLTYNQPAGSVSISFAKPTFGQKVNEDTIINAFVMSIFFHCANETISQMIMVKAVKWVDEVIPDAPYAITEEFMKRLFDEYQIDYIIHGDDPCVLPDGTDAYALAKKAGRYKQIKRTEGVSSTDIVGRMLLCVRERSNSQSHSSLQRQFSHGHNSPRFEDGASSAAGTRVSHFLPTSRRIVQFSNGKAVKWVDEVIPDAPYAITEEFMKRLFDEYQIDYIIHGDDPCVLPDGTDAYALAKKAGRYKQIKRTEGVSSTDIVGRMLLCVRERSNSQSHSSLQRQFSHGHNSPRFEDGASSAGGTRVSHFLPTSRRIVQFSNGKGPGPGARIIYIDGAFDLFHAGHVEKRNLKKEASEKKYYEQKSFVTGD